MKKRLYILFLLPLLTSCEGSITDAFAKAQKYIQTLEEKRMVELEEINKPGFMKVFNYKFLPNKCAYKILANPSSDIFNVDAELISLETVVNKYSNWIYSRSINVNSSIEQLIEWDSKTKLSKITIVENGQGTSQVSSTQIEKGDWYAQNLTSKTVGSYLIGYKVNDALSDFGYDRFFEFYDGADFKVKNKKMESSIFYNSFIDKNNMVSRERGDSGEFKEIQVKIDASFSNYTCIEYNEYLEFEGQRSPIVRFFKVDYRTDFLNRMRSY